MCGMERLVQWMGLTEWSKNCYSLKGPRGRETDCMFKDYNNVKVSDRGNIRGVGQIEWFKEWDDLVDRKAGTDCMVQVLGQPELFKDWDSLADPKTGAD